jgi:hypothetical protein
MGNGKKKGKKKEKEKKKIFRIHKPALHRDTGIWDEREKSRANLEWPRQRVELDCL